MKSRQGRLHPFYFFFILEGGLGLLAFPLAWFYGFSPIDLLEWRMESLAFGFFIAVALFVFFFSVRMIHLRVIQQTFDKLQRSLMSIFQGWNIFQLAMISLAAGMGEELFFRGFLQPLLIQQTSSISLLGGEWIFIDLLGNIFRSEGELYGLLFTSLIFGLMHPLTPLYMIFAVLGGFVFGWSFLFFENLLVPISAHFLYDFVALYVLRRSF